MRIGISPHAPYTCSLDTYRWCLSLGIPVGTHLAESANEDEWLQHGSGPLSAIAPLLVPAERQAVGADARSRCSGPSSSAPTASSSSPRTSRSSPQRAVPVAHCPRSNALLGCGIAPLAELREAGVVVGLGTDSPASTPSFDVFEEMRTAIYVASARERRAEALQRGRCPPAGDLGFGPSPPTRRPVGTLTPGKRADLAVVSLAGSPYHPVEDPAAAVVLGGSPERVLETIVDGQTRYVNEDNEKWREVRNIASAARQQMLAPRQ